MTHLIKFASSIASEFLNYQKNSRFLATTVSSDEFYEMRYDPNLSRHNNNNNIIQLVIFYGEPPIKICRAAWHSVSPSGLI
jgi:hypothetical protein